MSEVWLSGPVEGVHPLLMPAAHSFLQAKADVAALLDGLSGAQIWSRPAGSASMGFHALHLAGATDRLLTYARGEQLTDAQLAWAKQERVLADLDRAAIVAHVSAIMDRAVDQLRATSPERLTDAREVGRQRLPSTVIGLIFHAAEHATRHAGQLATLKRIVAGEGDEA